MLLEHMSEALAAEGRIEIRGFGSFNVRQRPARLAPQLDMRPSRSRFSD